MAQYQVVCAVVQDHPAEGESVISTLVLRFCQERFVRRNLSGARQVATLDMPASSCGLIALIDYGDQAVKRRHSQDGAFLLSKSLIDPGTIQAFLETDFRVHGDTPFTLRVGEASAALAAAHKLHGVDCSVYITACNPFSKILDDSANSERHAALGRELGQQRLAFIEGVGQHPSNQWPGEPSFLVFGLTVEAAKALGTHLEQNAIIWCGSDVVPQLICLR